MKKSIFKDFQLEKNQYNRISELDDENALIISIRNLLLSKPGNFPFTPSLGLDIERYQFELLDDIVLKDIQKELEVQISKFIPNIASLEVLTTKVEDENGTPYLCISVGANMNGKDITSNFILLKEHDKISIFNEIS